MADVFGKALEEFERVLAGESPEQRLSPQAALRREDLQQVVGQELAVPEVLAEPAPYGGMRPGGAGGDGAEWHQLGTRKREVMSIKKGANQNRKRNALGRGLSALMTSNALEVQYQHEAAAPQIPPAEDPEAELPRALQAARVVSSKPLPSVAEHPAAAAQTDAMAVAQGLYEVALSALVANPNQPRQYFSEEEIAELANSLKTSGVLQPILVRSRPGVAGTGAANTEPKYEIIAGERRYRAAKMAGLSQVPVLVRELDDKEVLEVSIVENVQRSQLNAVEEAQAYARLQAEYGLSQEEVADTVGKDRVTIANSLRLLKLPEKVQDMLIAGQLSAGHARALLMLEDRGAQERAAKQVVEKLLSVRATEQLVRDSKAGAVSRSSGTKNRGASPAKSSASIQRQALEDRFRRALGTKVQLRLNSRGAGELKISFFSQEELEKLLDVLGA